MKHFSPAADNNKDHILQALLPYLSGDLSVLEIGSGSGQHALHLAHALPNLTWQPTDRGAGFPDLVDNIGTYGGDNISPPALLDLADDIWPVTRVDRIYSANVLHIVPEALGERLLMRRKCSVSAVFLCFTDPLSTGVTSPHRPIQSLISG
jgi:hypothetical protein